MPIPNASPACMPAFFLRTTHEIEKQRMILTRSPSNPRSAAHRAYRCKRRRGRRGRGCGATTPRTDWVVVHEAHQRLAWAYETPCSLCWQPRAVMCVVKGVVCRRNAVYQAKSKCKMSFSQSGDSMRLAILDFHQSRVNRDDNVK
jgi:hypothetical protein